MRRPPLAAAVLFLGLSLHLGPSPLSARPLQVAQPLHREAPTPSWNTVWEIAMRKLSTLLKNGSGVDPFGQPAGITSTPPSGAGDNGSGVDPFGGK